MGSINQEDIIRIFKILDESHFDELHLEMDEIKLHVKKKSNTAGGIEAAESQAAVPSFVSRDRPAEKEATQLSKPPDRAPVPDRSADVPPGLVPIKAPMLGTFYRAPEPGAPPFVEVGQRVSEDDVVCIIEVMKLFTTITAGVNGVIKEICAENDCLVEYKQTLFLVEEEEEGGVEEGHTA